MKKIIFTVLLACLVTGMWAKEMPKPGLGIQIGWSQPILRLNDQSTAYPKDSLMNVTKLNGFKVGVVYDASYVAGFGSSIGINYTFAAGHTAWRTTGITNYPRMRTQTLYQEVEVFVDWQYKFEVAKETYLMLYTGPSIQCGIAWNTKNVTQTQYIDGSIATTTNPENRYIRHENDGVMSLTDVEQYNNDLKRFNVTWGIGAGFQYRRYFLRGGYDFGLINPYAHEQFIKVGGATYDRYTRGRLDQWSIKIGMYLWYYGE